MYRPVPRLRKDFALFHLVPNMMTIAAICAGLTSIRFSVQGMYLQAVLMIFAAAVLDGLDGRIARLIGSHSLIGAELDSLADFLNFGVASPLVIYWWALTDMRGLGWLSVLVFAVCCVLRLARFNVAGKTEESAEEKTASHKRDYFVGVPSPAGALLAMLPLYLSFGLAGQPVLPDVVICAWMIAMGLLMISRVPTWSFKGTRISPENVKYFLIGFVVLIAALFAFAWLALAALCIAYAATVIWTYFDDRKKKRRA